MIEKCEVEFSCICKDDSEKGCEVEWEFFVDSLVIKFYLDCIVVVEVSVVDVCFQFLEVFGGKKFYIFMISGVGYDSCYISLCVLISMIFMLIRLGISYNLVEYCLLEDW